MSQSSQPNALPCSFFLKGNCTRGDTCRFQHLPVDQETTLCPTPSFTNDLRSTTPCAYYLRGYCFRREKCWYKHQTPTEINTCGVFTEAISEGDAETKPDVCGICFEVPTMYGLLDSCEHVFCLECIRSWRGVRQATEDLCMSEVTRQCPLCRQHSYYIIPSSLYLKGEGKENAFASYKKSMSRVRCKYFEASNGASCLYGNACFFNHDDVSGNRIRVTRTVNQRQRPHALHFNGTAADLNFFSMVLHWRDGEDMLSWHSESSDYDSEDESEHEISDHGSDIGYRVELECESDEESSEYDDASDFEVETSESIDGDSDVEFYSGEQASQQYRIGMELTSGSEEDPEHVEEDSDEVKPDELNSGEGGTDEDGSSIGDRFVSFCQEDSECEESCSVVRYLYTFTEWFQYL